MTKEIVKKMPVTKRDLLKLRLQFQRRYHFDAVFGKAGEKILGREDTPDDLAIIHLKDVIDTALLAYDRQETEVLLKKYMKIMLEAQGIPRIDFDYCPGLTDEEKRRLNSYEEEIYNITNNLSG